MNKEELAKAIVNKCGYNITQECAKNFIDTFMDVIKAEMVAGNRVQLVGFGTFETAKRAERKGKNPQTGAEIVIPACYAPRFKPGKAFKDAVNQ